MVSSQRHSRWGSASVTKKKYLGPFDLRSSTSVQAGGHAQLVLAAHPALVAHAQKPDWVHAPSGQGTGVGGVQSEQGPAIFHAVPHSKDLLPHIAVFSSPTSTI